MPLCHQIAPTALRSKRDTTWTFPPWQLLRPEHPCFRLCRILLMVQLSPAVKDPRNPRKGTGKTHTFQGPFPPITCTTERTLSQGKLSTAISVSSGICYLLWLQHSAFHLEWGFKMWEMYHYLLPPPGGTYTWRSRLWQTPWLVPDSPAAGPWLPRFLGQPLLVTGASVRSATSSSWSSSLLPFKTACLPSTVVRVSSFWFLCTGFLVLTGMLRDVTFRCLCRIYPSSRPRRALRCGRISCNLINQMLRSWNFVISSKWQCR